MKKIFTLLFLAVLSIAVKAQLSNPITFETGEAPDYGWILFADGPTSYPEDMLVIANPYKGTPNPSDSVLQIRVHPKADPWVGMYSDAVGAMEFTQEAHTINMLVYKSIVSPCTIKLEQSLNGGAVTSVDASNTKTDEWELLSFEETGAIGHIYSRLTIFPDFPATARTGTDSTIVYLDNISTSPATAVQQLSGAAIKLYPNPAVNELFVQFPAMNSIIISDLLGKTIKTYSFDVANSKSLDLTDLKTGIYFISAKTITGTYTSKFMKK